MFGYPYPIGAFTLWSCVWWEMYAQAVRASQPRR